MKRKTLTILMALVFAAFAHATTTFRYVANGTANGNAVNAQADFTIIDGSLSLTLTNLFVNPTGVGQNVSAFAFELATLGVDITGGSMTGSSGLERSVASNKSYTNGSTVATGWSFTPGASANGGVYTVNVLGTGVGPAHTLIGSPNAAGLYSSANGSIAGNGPHNAFLAGPLTFVFNIAGLTEENSSISLARFSFGTTPGVTVDADCVNCFAGDSETPEPLTMALTGTGLIALYFIGRKKAGRSRM